MALQKQAIDFPVGVGIDQKTDDIWQRPGKLIESINTRVLQAGGLYPRKAFAYDRDTGNTSLGITNISQVNGERVYMTTKNEFFKPTAKVAGLVSPCGVSEFGIPASTYKVTQTDVGWLSTSGLWLVAWIIETGAAGSGIGDVCWVYLDGTTLVPVCQPVRQTTSNTVNAVRVCATATAGYLIYSNSTPSLIGVQVASDGTSSGTTTIHTFANPIHWDVAYVDGQTAALGIIADGTTLYASKIAIPAWTLSTATITPGGTVTTVHRVGAGQTNSRLFVAWHATYSGPSTSSKMAVYDYSLGLVTGAFTLTNHLASYGFAIAQSPSTDVVVVASSEVDGGTFTYNTRASEVTAAGAISNYMLNLKTVVTGKPITVGDWVFIPATLVDYINGFGSGVLLDFYSTGQTVNAMAPCGIWSPRQLAVRYGSFPEFSANDSLTIDNKCAVTSWTFAGPAVGHMLDFADRTRHFCVQSGDLHYLGGSLPMVYDGQRLVEISPLQLPRLPNANVTDGGGSGNLSAGNYSYVITYRWVDCRGHVTESATSPTSEGRITSLAINHKVSLSIPTLTCSMRETYGPSNSFQKAEIYIYRTVANGTVYYFAGKVTNDAQNTTVTYLDNLADASLVVNPIVYTQGGALANDFPDHANAIAAHKSRLWIAAGNVLWYSKFIQEAEGPGFADSQTMSLASKAPITALFGIDDKLVISTGTEMYILVGDGPTDSGQQNDYADPVRISPHGGAVNQLGVISTRPGTLVWTSKGIYRIDRGMTVDYVGTEVEQTVRAHPIVTATARSENTNRVFIACTDGTNGADNSVLIVHDYVLDVWSYDIIHDPTLTITPCKIDAMLEINGNLNIGTRTGFIGVESANSALDWTGIGGTGSTKAFTFSFTTPWGRVGAIAGFQRVWRATLTGFQSAPSIVAMYLANDYRTDFETGRGWTAAELTGLDRLQLSAKPTKQKVEALKVKVVATCDNPTTYPPYVVSAITLELGMKSAAKRLPAGQRK